MKKSPRCPCCNKPIPKRTEWRCAPREPDRYFPVKGWSYQGNLIVVSRSYAKVDGEKRLGAVSVWDGETYRPKYKYFCSNICAAKYGRRAVEMES